MTIPTEELKDVIIATATEKFGTSSFRRRQLMIAVEARLRVAGALTYDDDQLSRSVGVKSRAMAQIDWRITDLGNENCLINVGRDQWRLPYLSPIATS
jgi:hypothetical protein